MKTKSSSKNRGALATTIFEMQKWKNGTSVAVENAQPEIKKQVDFIVKSNNNGGIADLIEKFVFYHSNN